MTIIDRLPGDVTAPWCRSERILWRRTLGGVVVLPVHVMTQPVELRGPAAAIWELLEHPMTADELIAALAGAYGVHEAQVAGDVASALDVLLELGALCRG